jgi:hypothetical protein
MNKQRHGPAEAFTGAYAVCASVVTCFRLPLVTALTLWLCVLPAVAPAPHEAQLPVPDAGVESETLAAFRRQDVSLPPPYRAVRRLEAANRRTRKAGWLRAITQFRPPREFTYIVLDEGGAGIIRDRVLRPALEAELAAFRGNPRVSALVPENYDITDTGAAVDGLVKLRLKPRRKAQTLIDGFVLVTRGEARIVRVEGQLAKNPSFWTTEVQVVREYALVNGVNMPIELSSRARIRIFGESEFRMQIRYESIAGVLLEPAAISPSAVP